MYGETMLTVCPISSVLFIAQPFAVSGPISSVSEFLFDGVSHRNPQSLASGERGLRFKAGSSGNGRTPESVFALRNEVKTQDEVYFLRMPQHIDKKTLKNCLDIIVTKA